MRSAGLSARLISRERLVVAIGAGHPLARADAIDLGELRDEDFIAHSAPGSVVNAVVTQACLELSIPTAGSQDHEASHLLHFGSRNSW
jgi:DNA-binding transcriptional LysR family regulator